ncbi:hypothetical protein ACFL5V_05265 [Fibrobacterota bacterium]
MKGESREKRDQGSGVRSQAHPWPLTTGPWKPSLLPTPHSLLIKPIAPLFSLLIAILILLIPGCRKEEFQIDKKFVNLYVELRLADLGNRNNEKKATESRKIIFSSHEVKPEEFGSYLDKIIKRPEIWAEFQNQVLESLKEIEKKHKGE